MPPVTIRRQLTVMIMMITVIVLLLTAAASFCYEYVTFRNSALRNLNTVGAIIATNSTAALAFDNRHDARDVLSALRAQTHITAAGLYTDSGKLFATYPAGLTARAFPGTLAGAGYYFRDGKLVSIQPVLQSGKRLGTLYLQSDMGAVYAQLRLRGIISAILVVLAALFAYVLSRRMQRQITAPILMLAQTARAVSDHRDYSVRAAPAASRELHLLTEAFNHMLQRIQQQHEAVAESELRLRSVLNSTLTAVIVIDDEGRILDWNMRAEQMFGWPRNEALGRQLSTLIIPERHRAAHELGLRRFQTHGPGPLSRARVAEFSALRRDGEEFPIELSVSALRSGASVTFCGFVTDITVRKRSESRVRSQLSRLALLHRITRAIAERQDLSSIFHVVLRNLEDDLPIDFGCVCLYDSALHALTAASIGARSAQPAAAMQIDEQTRIPIDGNGLARCIGGQLVYEPDTAAIDYPFPQRLARGGLHSVVIAPLLVESQVFGVLVAARRAGRAFVSADCEFLSHLSEHVALAAHHARLYGALQQAYDDLRQTQQTVMQQERLRALGQMASGIAHDINNAISPVALYTESLLEREPNLSLRARGYLQTIQRAIGDVAHTVARMREFYRQRETALQLTRIDVNRTVEEVVDLTRPRWRDVPQQLGIEIRLYRQFASDLPAVRGTESELRDALTNLIFNAVDAMPRGGDLTLRTCLLAGRERPGGGTADRVCIEICDTGIGMTEEIQRRCLEPFYTTKGERGTGLGLPMVYGMVRRHGADLTIDSAPGAGTTVRLIFAAAQSAAEPAVRPAVPRIPPERRLNVLIVDDDPLLARSLRDILEEDGHRVTVADGGQAGIDAFRAALERSEPFTVVITDLGMPHVDGRKVAAIVRTLAPEVPIILLTGWGQRLLADGDIPAHADRILSKPPRIHELRAALATLTSGSKHDTPSVPQ